MYVLDVNSLSNLRCCSSSSVLALSQDIALGLSRANSVTGGLPPTVLQYAKDADLRSPSWADDAHAEAEEREGEED